MVVMGCIGAPFGVKGWVHVHSFTEPPEHLLQHKTWGLKIHDQWQMISVLESKIHGKDFVALLEGYTDREEVKKLTNLEIGVEREALPVLEPGEYYWTDLIGMTVVNENEVILGVVESLFETGSNDVLVVKGESREHLIPYIPNDYVVDINPETRVIRVIWDQEF